MGWHCREPQERLAAFQFDPVLPTIGSATTRARRRTARGGNASRRCATARRRARQARASRGLGSDVHGRGRAIGRASRRLCCQGRRHGRAHCGRGREADPVTTPSPSAVSATPIWQRLFATEKTQSRVHRNSRPSPHRSGRHGISLAAACASGSSETACRVGLFLRGTPSRSGKRSGYLESSGLEVCSRARHSRTFDSIVRARLRYCVPSRARFGFGSHEKGSSPKISSDKAQRITRVTLTLWY